MPGLSLFALTLLLVSFFSIPTPVQAQDTEVDCIAALTEAETAYFNGAFDQTLALLQPCVEENNYSSAEAQLAFTLLGRTHFVLGETGEAKMAIESLFLLNPDYTPPTQFPPNFVSFITSIKADMTRAGTLAAEEQAEPVDPVTDPAPPFITEDLSEQGEDEEASGEAQQRRRKNLFLFGGGAAIAVAGVTTAILLGGGAGGESPPTDSGWPEPPGRP